MSNNSQNTLTTVRGKIFSYPTTIRLPIPFYQELAAVAKQQGRPLSSVARDMTELGWKHYRRGSNDSGK